MSRIMRTWTHKKSQSLRSLLQKWWDPQGSFKPLHLLNPLRLDFIERHSEGLFNKQVLDVGCGGGILSESMARCGALSDRALTWPMRL